jgi:phage-related baseplate assembly protein
MENKNKKFVSIDYSGKDFNTIKQNLTQYAKRYYPDTFQDFTEASFGSLVLDSVAYVGDLLSFYMDYQYNESLLATTNDFDNAIRLARQLGYKFQGSPSATGKVAIYALVPAGDTGRGPNRDLLPIIKRNTTLLSSNGNAFIVTKDVRLDDPANEIVAARISDTTDQVTSFAVKGYADVISGEFRTIEVDVGAFQKFKKVLIEDANVTEIISVVDSSGNEYFEVENLSEEVVYKEEINVNPNTRQQTPSILVPTPVPRRFISEKGLTSTILTFGHGSENTAASNVIPDPTSVAFEQFGRSYITDVTFDPKNLIGNSAFGIAPENTTLTIKYRRNIEGFTNASAGTITTVTNAVVDFNNIQNTTEADRTDVIASLEVLNEEPITAGAGTNTLEELRELALNSFAAQNRAVTAQDYEALCYTLPPQFGNIRRARAVRDADANNRNINLYVLAADQNGKLESPNNATKTNIKNWLNRYRMIGDTIDIQNGVIMNFGINFCISVFSQYDSFEVLEQSITTLQSLYARPTFIGQPLNVLDVYAALKEVDGVADVQKVEFVPKTGTDYNNNFINLNRYTTPDGRRIIPPENVAFQIKFPTTDIKGEVK